VGIEIHHKVGDYLEAGEALFTVHADSQEALDQVRQPLMDAHQWSDQAVEPLPLFYETVMDRE